jgi:hypothetical protein
MMLSAKPLERKLQVSGIILMVGLLVDAFSLMGRGPIAFLVFVCLGGLLVFVGIAGYLLSLLGEGGSETNARSE